MKNLNLCFKSPERLRIFRSVSVEMAFKTVVDATKEHKGKKRSHVPAMWASQPFVKPCT